MKNITAAAIACFLLILLFAYTAFSKLFFIEQFRYALWQVPLIGPGADVVAWAVPLSAFTIVLLPIFFKPTLLDL